jgi:thiol-disulfide isomerase/thioredoxin
MINLKQKTIKKNPSRKTPAGKLFIIIFALILLSNVSLIFAQVNVIKIPLRIDKSVKFPLSRQLFYKEDLSEFGLSVTEDERTTKVSENVLVKVKRLKSETTAFQVWVDGNLNGKLDEKPLTIKNNSEIIVQVKRKTQSGKFINLPYSISYDRSEKKDKTRDYFFWQSHYRAAGELKFNDCSSPIFLQDFTADGVFDDADTQATNLQIDRNRDGRIWGKEEHARSNEIIEFCGQNFLVAAMASDGSSITLQPTNLRIAKVGEKVPDFSLVLLNGKSITSESLQGKSYILDFWASWCVPCVENLPQVTNIKTQFENELSVISVNVDKPSRRSLAEQIIQKYQLFDFSVIRGLGEDDLLWKTFGGANLNRLAIPLYVLVDKNGTIRYANNGGKDLKDLREKILELETGTED